MKFIEIDENYNVHSIWHMDVEDSTFTPVLNTVANYIERTAVNNLFVTDTNKFGALKTRSLDSEANKVEEWNHFYYELDNQFVYRGSKTLDTVMSERRANKNVLKRSLEEITPDALNIVGELISEGVLYRGEQWQSVINEFNRLFIQYRTLANNKRDTFCWANSKNDVVSKLRNSSIGVLLQKLSEGEDVESAVKFYNVNIAAPENYQQSKPIFTERMKQEALKTAQKLGILDSLPRRFARLSDISINDLLFANHNTQTALTGTVFDELMPTNKPVSVKNPKKINIKEFIDVVLPNVRSLQVLLENKHVNNFMSLIAPVNKDAPPLLKWNNNFGWAYVNNLTDSSMKQEVQKHGGKVDGVLRFSIQWNEPNYPSTNDLDAHCIEPRGNEIYYASKVNYKTKGNLDVDIRRPNGVAVENITWPNIKYMQDGHYTFFVHNYNSYTAKNGFSAEIEFNGEIYTFEYRGQIRDSGTVEVAIVEKVGNTFKMVTDLQSTVSSKEVWNLQTNQFHEVNAVMYSPNYWGGNEIGHRHYFFMLEGAINPDTPSGFFNEFLLNDLREHRKVFQALSNKMKVEHTVDQLSGLGFTVGRDQKFIIKTDNNVVYEVTF
jgi:hypothetical protein